MSDHNDEKKVEKVTEHLKDKRQFAKEQYEFLKGKGVTSRMRLSRIFKAAGPGQVQAAWNLATSEDWATEEGKARKDLLHCILIGSDCINFGWKRMEAAIKEAKFKAPEAYNSKCFFRILDGACEILVPGSFEFTNEEMEEIKDGLNKRMYDGDDAPKQEK